MARVVAVSGARERRLVEGWELARAEPDSVVEPDGAVRSSLAWQPARVPGTVAASLLEGPVTLDSSFDADACDWWYRTRFDAGSARSSVLRLEGLATLADVWLGGRKLLATDNMFVAHELDLSGSLGSDNEIWIRFRSLTKALEQRRGRARWRTRFVTNPALRQVRTTLFGRMPGWTPLSAAVGPWRPITLIETDGVRVRSASVRARLEGSDGRLDARIALCTPAPIDAARLFVGDVAAELSSRRAPDGTELGGSLRIANVERWWPHTHGAPALYPVAIELERAGQTERIELGKAGFRTLEAATHDGGFELRVNGVSVFCRGACWMPLDALTLDAGDERVEAALRSMQRAGMNMVRVAGTGVYETPRFHELCDELGILVWQDFAFARLDYPEDAAFVEGVRVEAGQLLDRLELSPSLAVACGNSEVEQQAAMLGLDPALARSKLFEEVLPEIVAARRPDVAYVPSTPSGGPLPFVANRGVCHYFGVGAYRRPLADARLAGVRFAAECLAFSNLPSDGVLGRLDRWKSGIPQDAGASWDFEDIREHYLEAWFGVSARELRAADPERWLELGRVVTGEVMAHVLGEWRRRESPTHGALIWHLADWSAGAGCGLLDRAGDPKAAYWFVARALRPIRVQLIDEGLNGVWLHVINETDRAFAGEVGVSLYREGRVRVARGTTAVAAPARATIELSVETLVGAFVDASYAYRFGPPGHDVIAASLLDLAGGQVVSDAFLFPTGVVPSRRSDLGLCATLRPHGAGSSLELVADALAYAVHVEADGMSPDDDYFHLEPGRARTIELSPRPGAHPGGRVRVSALNSAGSTTARIALEAAR